MLAAARRVGVDHSTVARRLTNMEATLGARLFDRSPRGVTPTPAAFALVSHAERIESELLAALSSVAGRDREVEGTVRRSEERRVGKECVNKCTSRWSQYI